MSPLFGIFSHWRWGQPPSSWISGRALKIGSVVSAVRPLPALQLQLTSSTVNIVILHGQNIKISAVISTEVFLLRFSEQFRMKHNRKWRNTWKKLSSASFRVPSLSWSEIRKIRVKAFIQAGFIYGFRWTKEWGLLHFISCHILLQSKNFTVFTRQNQPIFSHMLPSHLFQNTQTFLLTCCRSVLLNLIIFPKCWQMIPTIADRSAECDVVKTILCNLPTSFKGGKKV